MTRYCVLLLLGALLALSAFAGEKEKSSVNAQADMELILSCFGYGYKVKVVINGLLQQVKGGKSESLRLFNQDHELASQVPPDMKSSRSADLRF